VVRSIGIDYAAVCGSWTSAAGTALRGSSGPFKAEVVGIEIARNLVEAGNKRAAEAGLSRLKFSGGGRVQPAGGSTTIRST
jgi:hypothetical protein